MSMMTSQILKFVDFTKTQQLRYLEKKSSFFLQIKKIINYASRPTLWQIYFAAEVTFKLDALLFDNPLLEILLIP